MVMLKSIFDFLWDKILNTNFFQGLISAAAIMIAYFIGKRQNQLQDIVEIYVAPAMKKFIGADGNESSILPVLQVQNVGTRHIYLDRYIFNGREYLLDGQLLPSTYSQSSAFYWIDLPTNTETYVSLKCEYRDIDGRHWQSEAFCEQVHGVWKVKSLPKRQIK